MKISELLLEAKKIKWTSEGKNDTAEWMGHKLEVKFEKTEQSPGLEVHTGYIDGKVIKTLSNGQYGNREKLRDILEREVADAPLVGKTIKSLIAHVKGRFKQADMNGWEWQYLGAGDFLGKNKSTSFGVEVEKQIRAEKKDIGPKQTPSTHRFVLQSHFEPSSTRQGHVSIWLAQGGQIISIGAPEENFKQGDIEDMIAAMKRAMKVSDSAIIKALYKSGYENYGRA